MNTTTVYMVVDVFASMSQVHIAGEWNFTVTTRFYLKKK